MSAARTCPGSKSRTPRECSRGAFALGGAARRGQEGPAAPGRSHWQAGGTHNRDLSLSSNGSCRIRSANHVEPVRAGASRHDCGRGKNYSGDRERYEAGHCSVLLTVLDAGFVWGGRSVLIPIWAMRRGRSSHTASHTREISFSASARTPIRARRRVPPRRSRVVRPPRRA